MSILTLRTFGDPILRTKGQDVTTFDDDLQTLVDDMFETMYAAPGVGLAAPQVGVSKRLLVYDSGKDGAKGSLCNGAIAWASDETNEAEEGCLSLPGLYLPVVRATRVIARGLDPSGAPLEIEAEGLHARILQHEIDHTNGVLFIDRLTPDLRKEAMRRLREQELGLAPAPAPGHSAL
jgi:peptide deformylase